MFFDDSKPGFYSKNSDMDDSPRTASESPRSRRCSAVMLPRVKLCHAFTARALRSRGNLRSMHQLSLLYTINAMSQHGDWSRVRWTPVGV